MRTDDDRTRGLRAVLAIGGMLLTSACDQPGPLSAAARRNEAPPPAAPTATNMPAKRPPPPSWAPALIGKELATVFPATMSCLGAVDALTTRYEDTQAINGWAWNPVTRRPVTRVVAINRKGRFVGFGEGGQPRPDVPRAQHKVRSGTTGWTLITNAPAPNGVRIYGVDFKGKAACRLGEIKALA